MFVSDTMDLCLEGWTNVYVAQETNWSQTLFFFTVRYGRYRAGIVFLFCLRCASAGAFWNVLLLSWYFLLQHGNIFVNLELFGLTIYIYVFGNIMDWNEMACSVYMPGGLVFYPTLTMLADCPVPLLVCSWTIVCYHVSWLSCVVLVYTRIHDFFSLWLLNFIAILLHTCTCGSGSIILYIRFSIHNYFHESKDSSVWCRVLYD